MNRDRRNTTAQFAIVLLSALLYSGAAATAQTPAACGIDGYRAIARRWDAVLGTGWELRQNCAHPEWPARSIAVNSVAVNPAQYTGLVESSAPPKYARPLLVRAGDTVRLWLQDEKVRIEMTGVAEQSARDGEPVVVRVTHQSDDAGLTVERIAGIVRAPGDVEMER